MLLLNFSHSEKTIMQSSSRYHEVLGFKYLRFSLTDEKLQGI